MASWVDEEFYNALRERHAAIQPGSGVRITPDEMPAAPAPSLPMAPPPMPVTGSNVDLPAPTLSFDDAARSVAAQRPGAPMAPVVNVDTSGMSAQPIDQAPPPEMAQQQQFAPQFRPSAPGSAFVKTGEQTQTQGGLAGPDVDAARTAAGDIHAAQTDRMGAEQMASDGVVTSRQEHAGKTFDVVDKTTQKLKDKHSEGNWHHDAYERGTQALIDSEGKQKYEDSMMKRNPLQAIGFAIAAGVQAYANGIMGKSGPNEVLGMMNSTMDRDFAAWRSARGQKRNEIEDRVRGLAGLDKKFKTQEEQIAAFKAAQHDGIDAMLQKRLADTALPEQERARIMALQEQNATKRFEAFSQLGQLTGSRTNTSETKSRVSTGGGGPNPNTEEGRRLLTAMAAKDPVYQKILMVPDGETRKALEAEYAQYSKFQSAVPQIQAAFRDAADNATETAGIPGPDFREKTIKYKAGLARVKSLLKENMTGANSDADLENLVNPGTPGPRDTPESNAQKLRTLLENAGMKMQFPLMKGMGIVSGAPPAGTVKQGFKK